MEKKTKNILLIAGGLVVIAAIFRKPITKQVKGILNDQTKKDFLNRVYPTAKSIGKSLGVPPLFILAQWALESRYGQSSLSLKYFNYGGIKAVPGQKAVSLPTTECKNGICKVVNQNFAVYSSEAQGLAAQAKIYTNKYFKQYLNKTTNPIKYAELIQSGAVKYATSPNYVRNVNNTLKEINRLLT